MTDIRKDSTCSCCGGPDFKRCACPWDKPFEEWPKERIAVLKLNRQPLPGS